VKKYNILEYSKRFFIFLHKILFCENKFLFQIFSISNFQMNIAVGATMVHPVELGTQPPPWSNLLEGGVQKELLL
jgi:hypothetical protein